MTPELCRYATRLPMALAGAVALMACGGPSELSKEITEVRTTAKPDRDLDPNMSTAARFGYRMVTSGEDGGDAHGSTDELGWTRPQGWAEVQSTSMRNPNFVIGANPDAQCYVTTLSGDGGGIAANINRWRGQLSLAPLGATEIEGLERITVLDEPAVFVQWTGEYRGMGGGGQADTLLAGALLEQRGRAVFIKMVGPASQLEGEIGRFKEFCASLHSHGADFDEKESARSAPPARSSADAAGSRPGSGGGSGDSTSGSAGGFTWTAPAGWIPAPQRPMRLVTYQVGDAQDAECYITVLSGQAGGQLANLSRWRSQMGQGPVTVAELDSMEKIDVLGEATPVLETAGSFQGMGGAAREGYAMVAIARTMADQSIFVKLVGQEETVMAHKADFLAFCRSLEKK